VKCSFRGTTPPGVNFVPKGECSPLRSSPGVNTLLLRRMAGANREFHPQGITAPLGDNFAPGVQSLPLGAKLRMGPWLLQDFPWVLRNRWGPPRRWWSGRSCGSRCRSSRSSSGPRGHPAKARPSGHRDQICIIRKLNKIHSKMKKFSQTHPPITKAIRFFTLYLHNMFQHWPGSS
jgi:hypothetical protein